MKNNLLKILCLAVGLTLGFVLLAKVCFIEEYNSCIPEKERIYQILENFRRDKEEDFRAFSSTSGGVAPGMAAAIPEIECATRTTGFSYGEYMLLDNGDELKAQVVTVDSCFFDVFQMPVVSGNPKEILAKNGHAMVSRRLAEALGGVEKAVGTTVRPEKLKDFVITIDGVYENIPENCSFADIDLLLSIECWGEWSLTNWLGNDRYQSFARFREKADEEAVKEKMRKVQEAHVDMTELAAADVELFYTVMSLDDLLRDDSSLMNMKRLMLFLGLALIIVAVLNYLVIVVSTLVSRVKTIAVYKCFGASFRQLLAMVFRESVTHMAAALVLGAVLLFLIKDTAETLLAAKLASLFTLKTSLILTAISLALLAVTTFVPAYIFQKIPVAAAFRRQRESKRVWKLSLLFFQFAATAVIVCLLGIIARQYEMMSHAERGYQFDRLLVADVSRLDLSARERLVAELERRPEVEAVSNCFQLPFSASGNNVLLPGKMEQLFNVADLYTVADHYFDVMEIPVVEGSAFDPTRNNDRTVMVNREFVRKMEVTAGWKGSPVGREVCITEHSDNGDLFTIVGVFDDFLLGAPGNLELRPMVVFFDTPGSFVHPEILLVKLRSFDSESIARMNDLLAKTLDESRLLAEPFAGLILRQLSNERNIRDSLIICSLAALIIALVGLLGYTADEVNRRRKEIAILKVLGMEVSGILRILTRDITLVAFPALALGAAISFFLAQNWLEDYNDKIPLGFWTFALPTATIYIIILATVLLRSFRAARENPAEGIKAE